MTGGPRGAWVGRGDTVESRSQFEAGHSLIRRQDHPTWGEAIVCCRMPFNCLHGSGPSS
jgi:hypothetical protein